MKALQIVASALGRSIGGVSIRVDRKASTAMTDGRTVVLPTLPALTDSTEQADVTLGLVCHEAFHIRYTFHGTNRDTKPEAIAYTPFKKRLQNALEDPRIEHRGFQRYPGTTKFLDRVVAYLKHSGGFPDKPDANEHPGNLVIFGLLFHYRSGFLKQDLAIAAYNWKQAAVTIFGPDLWDQMVSIADAAVRASEVDAPDGPWWAAERIANLLGSAADMPDEARKLALDAVDAGEDDLRESDLGSSANIPSGTLAATIPAKSTAHRVNDSYLDSARQEANRIYRTVCGPLEAKLWARSVDEEWVSRTGTYGVVPTELYQARTTGRVFRARIEGDTRSIAVHLLIDVSASMGKVYDVPSPAYWAHAGALVLARLFAMLGIQWGISWFNTFWIPGRSCSGAPLGSKEPWEWACSGCTECAPAMSQAGLTLLDVDADRKLLIVLTDGRVNADAVSTVDAALLQQGIETRYALIGGVMGFDFAGKRAAFGAAQETAKILVRAFDDFA